MRPTRAPVALQDPWLARNLRPVLIGVPVGVVALAAIVYFVFILKSPEESYLADRFQIEVAVRIHISGFDARPASPDYGVRNVDAFLRYPNFGILHAGGSNAMLLADAGNAAISTLGGAETNPVGNTKQVGGVPLWEDVDGNGVRSATAEKLFYHDATPAPTVDHWNTTTVLEAESNIEYVVDSRDWFIDMKRLLTLGYLKDLPASASPDNHTDGTGSYSWYIDGDGTVKSLPYSHPVPAGDGFQGIYP